MKTPENSKNTGERTDVDWLLKTLKQKEESISISSSTRVVVGLFVEGLKAGNPGCGNIFLERMGSVIQLIKESRR